MTNANTPIKDIAQSDQERDEYIQQLTAYDWLPPCDRLVSLRRNFHRYPEPSWCEFRTTARLVAEFDRIGVDEYVVGPDALDVEERLGVPEEEKLSKWFNRAATEIDSEDSKFPLADVLDRLQGGYTGAVATVEMGEGPTIGIRVDIDALPITEATNDTHHPAARGFRSVHEGTMHACGHDAHMTFGLGVLEAIQQTDFEGTLKVFFQPAEEVGGGGHAMAATDLCDDIEYLIGVHIGLDHPTGEVVAGYEKPLAFSQFDLVFRGEAAHAGVEPDDGQNALQALTTGISNSYAVPRHEEGATRVNFGQVRSENASNIIADEAAAEAEVRGETTELMEYMYERVEQVLRSAAGMFDCELETTLTGHAPRADSDPAVSEAVASAAADTPAVTSIIPRAAFGASEDITHLMNTVTEHRGKAAFVGIGTDHPTGHHTRTFDVDEASLPIGVAVLTKSVLALSDQGSLDAR